MNARLTYRSQSSPHPALSPGGRGSKGHTLVELVIAANVAVFLMAGMATSIYVASQAYNQDDGTAGENVRATYTLTQFDRDISQALVFSELSANAAAFTVPDRDGDDRPETIRYAWSGTPGDPLTYEYNGSSPATLADDVQAFNLNSVTRVMEAPVIPPPGGGGGGQTVLLVVTNAATPTAQETARKSLVESWGYNVALITASDSQANYDAAVATSNVAYISEEINSSDVGTKLKDATIGVVNGEIELTDEFGFSSDKTWPSASDVTIVKNTHYITSEFATGPLTIASTGQSMTAVSGTLAPGLQVLGGYGGAQTLVCLAPGADLYGGGTAAGRRVQLPWGGGAFDINLLTNDGRTLLRRALEWGVGAGDDEPPPALLLVVSDPSNLTAEEVARKTLIESWGYSVMLIDDNDSQAVIDAAVAVNDVIYVPSNIPETSLGIKLRLAPLGLVNEPNELSQEHGLMNGGSGETSSSDITILDASHYITQVFSTGTLAICSSTQPLVQCPGNLGDALILAETSDPALCTLETGDNLKGGGGIAPARRVFLPWGTSAFDFDSLNSNGKTIMQRAIEWAAAPPTAPAGIVFEEFTEKIITSDTSSTTIDKPPGTLEGDLLIAAVVTNNDNAASLSPPAGWTEITVNQTGGAVTLGVWWKIAAESESATYQFTWTQDSEESYSWIMRFTGHDPADPIDTWSADGGTGSSPTSTPVISSIDNAMILRLGGFDDDDITPGDPGLSGHTSINMEQTDSTTSGGSGYVIQPIAGNSGSSNFSLTASEQYRTVTISIAPDPSP